MVVRKLYDEGRGKGSVASLASTCRMFNFKALKVLWEHMESLRPLDSLLPEQIQRCDGKCLAENGDIVCVFD